MTDLIQRLTLAIFRQEGNGPTHPNPGNLRDCPWFVGQPPVRMANDKLVSRRKYPDGSPVLYNGNFWIPQSRAQGEAGAFHVVALRVAMGQSLTQFISAWAPPSENDTAKYIANVKAWAAIQDASAPLWDYLMEVPT